MPYGLPVGTDSVSAAILTKISDSLEALRKNEPGFGTTGGVANAYTATFSPAHALATDAVFYLRIHAANTSACTLNVNGTGNKNLMKIHGASVVALAPGDVIANGLYQVIRDQTGDRYIVLSWLGQVEADLSSIVSKFTDCLGDPLASATLDSTGYGIENVTSGSATRKKGTGEIGGIWTISTGTTSGGASKIESSTFDAGHGVALSATERIFQCRVKTAANGVLTQKDVAIGLSNGNSFSALIAGSTGQGVFFRVSASGAGANIFCVTKIGSGANETAVDSGIADSSTMRRFEIRATSSSVKFYIDGNLISTQTTNIPAVNLSGIAGLRTTDAADKTIEVDWMKELIPSRVS